MRLKDFILYTYPDSFSSRWSKWCDTILNSVPDDDNKDAHGFQRLLGSTTSDDRSRASEMYKLGLLRGPLVAPQHLQQEVPLGWKLLSQGNNPQTRLGFINYLFGKLEGSTFSPRVERAFSSLCCLYVIQCGVYQEDRTPVVSYISLFEYLKDQYPKPDKVSDGVWLRYLAAGLFCTINDDKGSTSLIESFKNGTSYNSLLYLWGSQNKFSRLIVNQDEFGKLIKDEWSLTDVKPIKHSLFWIGTGVDQRGVYSKAIQHNKHFVNLFAKLETEQIRRGEPVHQLISFPFLKKDPSQEVDDVINLLMDLSKQNHELNKATKTLMLNLKDGALEALRGLFGDEAEEELMVMVDHSASAQTPQTLGQSYNKILFGPPGTGKSFRVDNTYAKGLSLKPTRITFHPDTDYASFVGSYKPGIDEKGGITYLFEPQAFAEAYVNSWEIMPKPYFLIIEEINRGNCAQIFGDLFQCLDRDERGYSSYPVDIEADFSKWLRQRFFGTASANFNKELKHRGFAENSFEKVILPCNLYIYATMNTSDQSLFPMDSAFKRRWDWEYVPISYSEADKLEIDLENGNRYKWGQFIQKVNKHVYSLNQSEDKQLGNWFVKPSKDGKTILLETFKTKVLFYLWSDVYKLESEQSIFQYTKPGEESPTQFTFSELFEEGKDKEILPLFMKELGLEPIDTTE